jgi:hypothetical protein
VETRGLETPILAAIGVIVGTLGAIGIFGTIGILGNVEAVNPLGITIGLLGAIRILGVIGIQFGGWKPLPWQL